MSKVYSIRHFGFEDGNAEKFIESQNISAFIWKEFGAGAQGEEILLKWPDAIISENN